MNKLHFVLGFSLILGLSNDSLAQQPAPEGPRIGQPIVEPEGQRVERTYGLLTDAPSSRIVEPGVFEITFITIEPTPPAMVYAGLTDVREELQYARYRRAYTEDDDPEGGITEHRIRVDFRPLVGYMPNTEHEPYVTWRAEVYVPSKKSSRFIEGRQYFDPATLGDAPNILHGPIVDQVTDDSALIVFETDRAVPGRVDVGEIRSVLVNEPSTAHAIRVVGLLPDTTYRYRVHAGGTVSSWRSFRTAGAAEFSFAAMVDSREGVGGGMQNSYGVNAFALFALGSDAYQRGASFILFPGDLINGYTTSVQDFRNQLHSFRRILEPVHARIPVFEGMGNHEALIDQWMVGNTRISIDKPGDESAEALFAEVFYNPENGPEDEGPGTPTYQENVYWFDWGPARFFMLNNNYWWSSNPHTYGGNLEGYILPRQMEWLRQQVARADRDDAIKFLFFAAQEPPFPNGGHTGDAMWYRGGDTNRDGTIDERDIQIVENRNEMWEIIAASPKSVAFITGDEHAYSRLIVSPATDVGHKRLPNGEEAVFQHAVWQITSGGAGAPWYDKELDLPWSPQMKEHSTQPHYAFFRVSGGGIDLEAYSQTGERIDSATLRRNGRNLEW